VGILERLRGKGIRKYFVEYGNDVNSKEGMGIGWVGNENKYNDPFYFYHFGYDIRR
jgi:hypothetical protein